MKKYLLCLILIVTVFTACKKEDDPVFNESPDTRITATLNKYQQELINAPYGWKGLIFPKGLPGSVFGFYFKFSDAGRVSMFSDFDASTFATPGESSYRLKALQQPCLLFDTYSYVHLLSDPDRGVNGGAYGAGLSSDFEFSLDSVAGDTIKLTGRFHKCNAYLIRATQQEQQDYMSLQRNRNFDHITDFITYWKRLTAGGKQYDIIINQRGHVIRFIWLDENGVRREFVTGFYYTPKGVAFAPAFTDGAQTITGIDNVSWDAASQVMKGTANGENVTISGSPQPLAPEKEGPRRWWEQGKSLQYWVGPAGFHSNGVDDAFGINTLPNYYFMGFWPEFQGNSYDLLGFAIIEDNEAGIGYGPAFRAPSFTTDGRVTFSYIGYLGEFPADQTPITRTRLQFTDASGYYLVQKGPQAWDMVSAKDGKTWINWFK
jgi:hypothetical protein